MRHTTKREREHSKARTSATTLPMPAGAGLAGFLLTPPRVVTSPETRIQYRIDRLLGEGGFGQVYLATRLGRSRAVPQTVCIKASQRIDGWLREAYFGQLLEGHPRAIRIFDSFPLACDGAAGSAILYCLALEYASSGDLRAFLEQSGRPWTESAARREIAGILQVLGRLHRGQLLHRDLTPMNVFVCEGRMLKLGDFGIVRHAAAARKGARAGTLNPMTAPVEMLDRGAPKWQARDDVYQVGQLLGMLIKGDARTRLRTKEIRRLPCSDHFKEIIYRCLGERRKRYESAEELIEALTHPPAALKAGRLQSLKGTHLAFTGILSRKRNEAARAAKRAGATVHGAPSARTNVVVRGRPNPLQAGGKDAGRKLIEIKRLREKGHRITILNETQFWRLAGSRPSRERN